MADDFVSREEFDRLKRIVAKRLKALEVMIDDRIGETWEHIAQVTDSEVELADQAIKKAERAQRTANRLQRRVEALENGE